MELPASVCHWRAQWSMLLCVGQMGKHILMLVFSEQTLVKGVRILHWQAKESATRRMRVSERSRFYNLEDSRCHKLKSDHGEHLTTLHRPVLLTVRV